MGERQSMRDRIPCNMLWEDGEKVERQSRSENIEGRKSKRKYTIFQVTRVVTFIKGKVMGF